MAVFNPFSTGYQPYNPDQDWRTGVTTSWRNGIAYSQPSNTVNPSLASAGSWPTATGWSPRFGGGSTATGSSSAGGLPLLQTSKSTAGNAALDAALGRASNLNVTPDPAQNARVAAGGAAYDANAAKSGQSLSDWTAKFMAGDAEAQANQQQESGAIGNWYGNSSDPNSVISSLNKLATQRNQAIQGSLSRALSTANRNTNAANLGFGGGSSYTNQAFQDTAAGVLAQAAKENADLNRANYLQVAQAQPQLAGVRAGLLNNYLMRGVTPIQVGQTVTGNNLGQLGQMSAISGQNQMLPAQLQGAQMGLLGNYADTLNRLNIFGVGGNFNTPGYGARSGMPSTPQGPIYGTGPNGQGTTLMNPQAVGTNTGTNVPPQSLWGMDPADQQLMQMFQQQYGRYPSQEEFMQYAGYAQAPYSDVGTVDPQTGMPVPAASVNNGGWSGGYTGDYSGDYGGGG